MALSEFGPATSDLNLGGHKITGLAAPTNSADAATKQYVDQNSSGGGGGATTNASLLTSGTLDTNRLPSWATGKVAYVSKRASATDTRTGLSAYDALRPFATVIAAALATSDGDTIVVEPGTYSASDATNAGLFTAGRNFVCRPGVALDIPSYLTVAGGGKDWSICGYPALGVSAGGGDTGSNAVTMTGFGDVFLQLGSTSGSWEGNAIGSLTAVNIKLDWCGNVSVDGDSSLINFTANSGTLTYRGYFNCHDLGTFTATPDPGVYYPLSVIFDGYIGTHGAGTITSSKPQNDGGLAIAGGVVLRVNGYADNAMLVVKGGNNRVFGYRGSLVHAGGNLYADGIANAACGSASGLTVNNSTADFSLSSGVTSAAVSVGPDVVVSSAPGGITFTTTKSRADDAVQTYCTNATNITSGTLPAARLPATAAFTTLVSTGRVNLPSGAIGSPASRDIYAVADTLRYRDSTNTERLLLNSADNLANLSNIVTARTNLGLGSLATQSTVPDDRPKFTTNLQALRWFYGRWFQTRTGDGGPSRMLSVMMTGDSLGLRLAGWLAADISGRCSVGSGKTALQNTGQLWSGGYSPPGGVAHSPIGLGVSWSQSSTVGAKFSGGFMNGTVWDVQGPVTVSASGSGTTIALTGIPVTTTATGSSGSPTLTVASATGLYAGMTITGTGIPGGTTIANISGTTVTLSANTTGALSSTSVTCTLPVGSFNRMAVYGTNVATGTHATAVSGSNLTLSVATTGSVSSVDLHSYLQFPGPQQFASAMMSRFGVYYVTQPGGGSFVLEYATSATANTWTQVGGTISTSGTLVGSVASASLPSRGQYFYRARVTSGIVTFIGGWMDDGGDTVAGFGAFTTAVGGISPAQAATCEAAIVTPILAHLDPALVTWHYDDLIDGTYSESDLSTLIGRMRGTVTTTATGSSGSTTITVASAAGIYVGMTANCVGSVFGSRVTAVSGTTITLSTATAAALSASSITFQTPCPLLIIANHADSRFSDSAMAANRDKLKALAPTYNYAVFDAYAALGNYATLSGAGLQGDGTHLSTQAYATAGAILSNDCLLPVSHPWLAGSTSVSTAGNSFDKLAANTLVVGNLNWGATTQLGTGTSDTSPALKITSDGTYATYFDILQTMRFRSKDGSQVAAIFSGNHNQVLSQLPPIWVSPNTINNAEYTSFGSPGSTGVTEWCVSNAKRYRCNSNGQRFVLGPIVGAGMLNFTAISGGAEQTQTLTVTGATYSIATTATGTSGATTMVVASATEVKIGQAVTGTGIAANTTVTAVSGATITLSAALTGNLSATAVTFLRTNTVILGWSSALPDGVVVKQVWVSGADTVSVRLANYTAGSITPGQYLVSASVHEIGLS